MATDSLRSQILMLHNHASAFVWANGSDGLPPPPVLAKYRRILRDLHWQNAVVDTVSSLARDADGSATVDGIDMAGPYSWRPPSYWFSGRYGATWGALAEQGDNEHIPPFASLKKFIPARQALADQRHLVLPRRRATEQRRAGQHSTRVDRRYGPSTNAEMFASKAQLAHYESTRAQFEAFAANGWASHKMTIYWMLNNHWPSFFGNLFDYYLRPGGAYYGAKKGLRPLSVVFDSYATGPQLRQGHRRQPDPGRPARICGCVSASTICGANVRADRTADGDRRRVPGGAVRAMTLPRGPADSSVFFVRCQLLDGSGKPIAENVYWQSQQRDDLGRRTTTCFRLEANELGRHDRAELHAADTAGGHRPAQFRMTARRRHSAAQRHLTGRVLRTG